MGLVLTDVYDTLKVVNFDELKSDVSSLLKEFKNPFYIRSTVPSKSRIVIGAKQEACMDDLERFSTSFRRLFFEKYYLYNPLGSWGYCEINPFWSTGRDDDCLTLFCDLSQYCDVIYDSTGILYADDIVPIAMGSSEGEFIQKLVDRFNSAFNFTINAPKKIDGNGVMFYEFEFENENLVDMFVTFLNDFYDSDNALSYVAEYMSCSLDCYIRKSCEGKYILRSVFVLE